MVWGNCTHALLSGTDEAAGVGAIWRGAWARGVTQSRGDEDRSSGVWRRWWRGAPQPPQQDGQDGQDEEAAVAQDQSLCGRAHGLWAWRVAEELPVDRHWCTVWGELFTEFVSGKIQHWQDSSKPPLKGPWRSPPLTYTSFTPKVADIQSLNAGKPSKKEIDSSPSARRGYSFLDFFAPVHRVWCHECTDNWAALWLVLSPEWNASITDDLSWSRQNPLLTAESFDPGVIADWIHSHCRQKPDVSGC